MTGGVGKLTVIYDAECVLCIRTVDRLSKLTVKRDLTCVPLQEADDLVQATGVPREQLRAQLHVVDESGKISRGADAVVRIMRELPNWRWVAMLYNVPGMRSVADPLYRLIARHRYRLFGRKEDCRNGSCPIDPSGRKTR